MPNSKLPVVYAVRHSVYCRHSSVRTAERLARHIGDTTWSTPQWCPLLPTAVERLMRKLKAESEGENG